ncbi:MAG TPA: transcriptional regulator [Oscillatoriales bacterium UBA8482]|nr:MAG: transcriptional regulator [Oscillatoriales cyanobacterium CG2_30_40_61]HBW57089.1 transcriptional regulator [Oscillatoriales bacterium UBA8482]
MTQRQQVLDTRCTMGVISAKDIEKWGVSRQYVQRLEQQGLLIRSGRGIYTIVEADITENHGLVEVSKRVPHGVICLLSALSFYQITTQAPSQIWLAIDQKARSPKEDLIPLRIIYMSGIAKESGIEEHIIEGVPVRVYSLAKTIADCFKFRNKIGLDIALEALRESWQEKHCTIDEIWDYAKICRVQNVIRPYLELLVS